MNTINIAQPQLTIDVVDNQPVINLAQQSITLDVESGGIIAANIDISLVAGVSISALRCITTNGSGQAVYATPDTLANAVVIGISTTSGSAGDTITVKTSGELSDASWSWTKGAIYLGANGALTQTAPSGGSIVVHVAKAITATKIIIDIDTIIQTV